MTGSMRHMSWARVLVPALALLASAALADEPRVEVLADVVRVSNQGNAVDPALVAMKETFGKEHFNFTSYQRLSWEKIVLQQGKASEVKLRDQQTATLKLVSLHARRATVEVSVDQGVQTVYTLGREGSVFINAGHLQDGELFLVLSPATAKKHHRLRAILRPWNLVHALFRAD